MNGVDELKDATYGNAVGRGRERSDEFVKISESPVRPVEAIQVGAVPMYGCIFTFSVTISNTYC